MADLIQPSSNTKATALAIAARLCQYGDYGEKGTLSTAANSTSEKTATEKAKIIAAVAKILCDAVDA